MNWNWTDLNIAAATPEIVLLCALFAVLLADLWTSDENRYITHYLSIGAMLAAAFGQIAVWSAEPMVAFNGMYVADGVAQLSKLAVYLGTAVLFVYAKPYNQSRGIFKGEFYTLAMFAAVGMSVMISASHFLTAYVGLELLSLALYAMIALRRDSAQASEAALKYFVLGALASGILLYGISMVYGATGSLQFQEIFLAAHAGKVNAWLLKLGVLFIVAAVAFKFGAAPFHMWVADVYQGAPTSVTAFVGSVPKIAATVFAFRILVSGLALQMGDWLLMFAGLAVLSLIVGNLAAIMQTNIKRMFAFSTVSHMGFILLAFLGSVVGIQAAIYYAVAYVLMSLAGFGVLMLISRAGHECDNISDLAGLNQRNAWYAFVMLLVLFSMAGIPPLVGFYAKFAVLQALLGSNYAWATALAVFAVVMSLIGAFYYLRVVKVMYFDPAQDQRELGGDLESKWILSLNALLLLVWGVLPSTLTDWIATAIKQTF
ncbi:NADH-quinone oxidoreductase subunit NuoN [Alysiella filiformis]|uniref:NADH-quinone oxidoreductase subunit N n=1 Tax=Alysiella filiformis DSM 16848 TaxID=1120981 RepID=A0A286E804_9NEIS|nr:NADH-quinone oxidoreductase subunit NuoN [Alysiella filiformis]QMT32037.1 NADH-quinone oxidoreductase subunit NuoN [Alysiella filiformis]UBQ57054.1 NADH-quinone oxidoreductase subunit NuoN [Alysiella filiformis DSM 16848]SOD67048.1 NADH-quinone oxidoreductase subunit N [Alysiella filiformis DSM 16848]